MKTTSLAGLLACTHFPCLFIDDSFIRREGEREREGEKKPQNSKSPIRCEADWIKSVLYLQGETVAKQKRQIK